MVDANAHTAAIVGDEPLLLARIAPCWVGTDRVRSAKSAIDAGANVLVLDDGLQNPALVKDLAFAVVDGETGFGNGLCVPAGPLRAPVSAQLPFVRALIVLGGDEEALSAIAGSAPGKPLIRASLEPDAARRRAADRPRGGRLRRHCATGEVLRHTAPRRRADCHDSRLRRPSPVHAARDRGADRGGWATERASGDHREGSRPTSAAATPAPS